MHNMKALVVDDSKVGRLTMKKKLEAFGVGVDLAESGLVALQYLEHNRPDMIFMDHMMPDLDGFETTRRIKAMPTTRDIPVIIISGTDDAAFVREARAFGALDVIAKPPSNEAIERILVSLPAHATAARELPPAATQPTMQPATTPHLDQDAIKAMIDTAIGTALERRQGDWLNQLMTRLEAEFENERQLQKARNSRLEQRIEHTAAGLADIARLTAEVDAMRQQLNSLETRLLALATQTERMATPSEAWLEFVGERVRLRLTELDVAERQAPMLDAVRQELLRTLDDRHAEVEHATQVLAGRIDALSEAIQQRMAIQQASDEAHSQRFESIEQRLADLEAAKPLPALDEAVLAPMETRLLGRITDLVGERHEPMAAELGRLREQLEAMGQAQGALTVQWDRLDARLEEGLLQLRAELEAALQSAVSPRLAASDAAVDEARLELAADAFKPAMAEPAADTEPAALLDRDMEARIAQRLTEEWNGRWQAEVQRLKGMVKTLTWATAAAGVGLLIALILLAR